MKSVMTFLFLLLLTGCSMQPVESQKRSDDPKTKNEEQVLSKAPVLVELFTSEGCSSCPAADRALAFLEKEQPVAGAEIITLALHVDYWNYLGWADEFSSPLFSERQEFYGQKFKLKSVYTPQMVVDGSHEFTGSDLGKASTAILEASKLAKAKVEILRTEDKLKINVSGMPAAENATVFLALAEDKLNSNVARGENQGKNLEHQSVVRQLKALGRLNPPEKSFENETILQINPKWRRENLKAIVFIQENESRKIIGIGRIAL